MYKKIVRVSGVAAMVACAVCSKAAFGDIFGSDVPPLFDDGKTEWKVVVAPDADPCVRFAVEEFTNAVARVSGVELPVVASDEGVKHAVRFFAGGAKWAKEEVEYRVKGDDLLITGNQPRAVLHSAYAFLDRELGVRWLWPGADGAFFPERKTWKFPSGCAFKYEPVIWFRGFHHCGDWRGRNDFLLWQTRNYANIHRHGNWKGEEKFGQYSMPSMHNANLNGDKKLFAEHPECYALLSGHRSMVNICFSSELGAQKVADKIGADIERRVKAAPLDVISIFPNDNQDYCQCPDCKALGVSTAWFRYYNKVVKLLKKRFPGLRFATIAYQGYLDVPDCRFEDTEFIEYASHPRCHVHKWCDETCKANVSEMKRFREWCARDDVKIGHYAYEYDAISGHSIFMPFFSMIGDAVEKAAEMKLVTQIPEVGLSPKGGPDVKAGAIQNRLTILYYARKMWQPDLTLEAFLDDLCKYAYGKAAKPMKEYFLIMDKAWGDMGGKIGLFADCMNVAANLLKDEKVRQRSAALLAEAEELVREGDERSQRNVMREKALYGQWTDYRDLRMGNNVSFKLPKVEKDARLGRGNAPKTALKTKDGKDGSAKVCGYWTPKVEIVFAFSGAAATEIALTDAYSERYLFSFRDGQKKARRVSDVGVEMTTWKPEWTAEKKGQGVLFRLPMSAFGHEPAANEQWDIRFVAGAEAYPVREDVTVKLAFLAAPAAERPIVFYAGDKRCLGAIPALRAGAEADGWKLIACTNSAELAANVGKADSYYLQVPDAKAFTPEIAAVIRENVRNGGSLIARSWGTVPLQKIFGDTNLVCACEAPKDYPLSERHAKYVREGDWCRKPWNFERTLRNWFSPCYMLVPYAPKGEWVEYASMPSKADEKRMIPFVSGLKYGKGVVILVGETLHCSHFWIIDNIRRDLGL